MSNGGSVMCTRWRRSRAATGGVAIIAFVSVLQWPVAGQAPTGAATNATGNTAGGQAPRTPWGDPDLQGTWDFTTITPLQRPAELAGKEFLSEAEAAAMQKQINDRRFETENRSPGALSAAPSRDDPGIYNLGWWWEPEGRKLVRTRRSSLV